VPSAAQTDCAMLGPDPDVSETPPAHRSRPRPEGDTPMTRIRPALAVFAALATASLALLPPLVTPAHAAKRDNSIRFAADQAPESIDPYFNNVRIGVIVGQHVWDTLIFRDPRTGEYKGNLATAWKWVDDKTLDVDIRQGVKFHNGEPLNADDVVYTLNFVSRPDSKVVTPTNVNWIDKAEKLGDFKVRIRTKKPFPAAIEYLAGPVVIHPNEYYAKVGPQGMNTAAIGTGPFRVTEHAVGKYLRLERNKDYFKDAPKGQPKVDKLEFRFIPDRQTQAAEMLAGGLDLIMGTPADQAKQLGGVPHLRTKSGETMRIVFLHFNTMDTTPVPALRDVRVRQAIGLAIDRPTMVKSLVGEGARVLNAMCYPSQFGCVDDKAPRFTYDVERARKLMAEAGFANGLELDLYAYREREQSEAMVNYLRAIGIKANLRFMQYAAMRDLARQNKAGLLHQTWGSFSVNDVSASTPVYFKFTPDDISHDEQVRAALEKGDSSVDPAVRKAAYAEALALIQQKWLAIPLYALVSHYVAAKDLEFDTYPDEMPRFWEMSWK
jgi:peptide/nickel transport system substrate-binding protein